MSVTDTSVDLAPSETGLAWRLRRLPVGGFVIGLAALCALVLVIPGQTVTTKYLSELFLALDGAYRVAEGQVPNRDFHTPLGLLTFYIPALAYRLSGSFGMTMPLAMALLLLALSPVLAHVLASRLRPAIALPFAAFLVLVLAVPITLGEGVTALTFAKFYNRIGWVALGALLVMYLQPARRQDLLDAACAALLCLVMIYTKAVYGVIALGFLVFMLTGRQQRRWAGMALAATAATMLVVEAVWRGTQNHIADLSQVWAVDGSPRGSLGQIIDHVLASTADYVLLALFAGLSLWRTRSLREALFYLYCAVGGFLIINQNFQWWGILTLHAAGAVAAETILRTRNDGEAFAGGTWSITAGAKLLFLALVLPTIVHCLLALGLHASAAAARAGEPVDLPNMERVRIANLWTWGDHEGIVKYAATIEEGALAVAVLPEPRGPIATLDSSNPFPLVLNASPPRGGTHWPQWGRTLDAAHAPGLEQLIGNARIVMEPKPPVDPASPPPTTPAQTLLSVYAPMLSRDFYVVRETENWRVHMRRGPT